MVDHSDVQEVVVADNLKKQQISDFIHDKHFIVKDDLHVLHSGRQVRRRRSSPEAFSGNASHSLFFTNSIYFHIKNFQGPMIFTQSQPT